MKIVTFTGYEFDPKKLLNKPECPELPMARMMKSILPYCPDDVDIREFANTTTISRGDKKVNISAWQFNLNDWPNVRPLGYFHKDCSEAVLVWGVQFFDNGKFRSDINDNANLRCALGYKLAEEGSALITCGVKAAQWASQFTRDVKEFLSDTDDLAQAIADHIPDTSNIKVTKLTLKGWFKLKENYVNVSYSDGILYVEIEHNYTMGERVYGDKFSNYSTKVRFNSVDEVNDYDWEGLWNKLYENREGTLIYHGSLGT